MAFTSHAPLVSAGGARRESGAQSRRRHRRTICAESSGQSGRSDAPASHGGAKSRPRLLFGNGSARNPYGRSNADGRPLDIIDVDSRGVGRQPQTNGSSGESVDIDVSEIDAPRSGPSNGGVRAGRDRRGAVRSTTGSNLDALDGNLPADDGKRAAESKPTPPPRAKPADGENSGRRRRRSATFAESVARGRTRGDPSAMAARRRRSRAAAEEKKKSAPRPSPSSPEKGRSARQRNEEGFFVHEEHERERFKLRWRTISTDGLYAEDRYDFSAGFRLSSVGEALRYVWNGALRGHRREYLRFDAENMERFYRSQPLVVGIRLFRVIRPFGWWLARFNVQRRLRRDSSGNVPDEVVRKYGAELCSVLQEMGPTFVKVGQALSQRPDLVGPVFSEQLKRLQDSVATFPTATAMQMFASEFGCEVTQAFDAISPEPIAAASLGQVYRAHLRGAPAEQWVALKVQRPNIGINASVDLFLTRRLSAILKRLFGLRTNLVAVSDEFASRLMDELNYYQEARNCLRFKRMYSDIDGIYIPGIYADWTTRYMLSMEWVNGTKAPWGADSLRLIDVGIQCTLRQLLDGGFFHADPHPGNLLRTADGLLAYLDFGMMSKVEDQKRYDLIGSVVNLINRDYRRLTEDLVKLEFLPEDADLTDIYPVIEEAFTKASDGGGKMSNLSFNKLAAQMAGVAFRTPIRLPPYYSLIIRSLSILEGIALAASSEFKIVDESFPYVSRRILFDPDPELRRRLREVLVDSETGRIRWNRLQTMISQGESSGHAGAAHAVHETKGEQTEERTELFERIAQFLLSSEGAFLRDALTEDLVDTLDSAQLATQETLSRMSYGLIPTPIDKPDRELLTTVRDLFRQLGGVLRRQPGANGGGAGGRGLKPARSALRNGPRIGLETSRAAREVFGSLLQRNSSRLWRRALRSVEGSIDRQIEREQRSIEKSP